MVAPFKYLHTEFNANFEHQIQLYFYSLVTFDFGSAQSCYSSVHAAHDFFYMLLVANDTYM